MDTHHWPESWEASFWHRPCLHSAVTETVKAGEGRRNYEWKTSIPMFSVCLQSLLPPPPCRQSLKTFTASVTLKGRDAPTHTLGGIGKKSGVVLLGLTLQPPSPPSQTSPRHVCSSGFHISTPALSKAFVESTGPGGQGLRRSERMFGSRRLQIHVLPSSKSNLNSPSIPSSSSSTFIILIFSAPHRISLL